MDVLKCCAEGFLWEGKPIGRTSKLADRDAYITGDNAQVAILFIADLFGWTFPNVRLLADHFAREVGATVYVPDFFGGEVLDSELIAAEKFDKLDLPMFLQRNGREKREPEIFECAAALRQQLGYKRVGAVGYCYGGWASLRLGAVDRRLVDCISIGHPSLTKMEDIKELGVPAQILAPEVDPAYTAQLKSYTFETLQASGLAFDYQHFPGVVHGCLIRGDEHVPGERAAMERGKNAVVHWFRQMLVV